MTFCHLLLTTDRFARFVQSKLGFDSEQFVQNLLRLARSASIFSRSSRISLICGLVLIKQLDAVDTLKHNQ